MNMYRSIAIALFLISSLVLEAQRYNPFVNNGAISPTPLPTTGGTGNLSFNTGNTGSDTLNLLGQNRMTLTIDLFYGEPNNPDPLAALGGSATGFYTWTYTNGTYTGRQNIAIPPGSTGTITIAYRVTRNSTQNNPGNGFRATIAPGPYSIGNNSTQDDVLQMLTWTQCNPPPAPVIGTVTQPTCDVATGSIILNGLPSTGTWTLTRYPGQSTSTGTGTTVTVTGLAAGTYSFTVSTTDGCVSPRSAEATINSGSGAPAAPTIGTITQPTCTTATGSVVLNGLPSSGTWTLATYPGGDTQTGTGTTHTVSGLSSGTYNFTVTAGGCTSPLSANAVINAQPVIPAAPTPGTITQPSCQVSTGSVILNGLPATGTWTLTRFPGEIQRTGTGTSYNFTGLEAGTYYFTVSTSAGCVSARSANVVINQAVNVPTAPSIGTVTQPTCDISTGSVVVNGLPANGTWTLTRNPGNFNIQGSGSSATDSGLPAGTYTYTVTNAEGCTSPSSSDVIIRSSGSAPAEPVVRVDCFIAGIVTVVEPVGNGLTYSLDNGQFRDSRTFVGVPNGLHTMTVRNSAGCTTTGPQFSVSCGCANRPSISLSSRTGVACGTTPLTVSGNTFGGSATAVSITEDGAGSLTASEITSSPFSFTYTPAAADAGNTVTITFTTNNPAGAPCTEAVATYALTVNSVPSAPAIGTITHPTCTTSTGSVVVNGLPAGSWTLIRDPGNIAVTGSGTSTTVSGIVSGIYTFSVSSNGCVSPASAQVQINGQPAIPPAPVAGTIVHPTCTVGTGSITLTGLPASGPWTLVRYPGNVSTSGTGSSYVIPSLAPGTYNFTVSGSAGCSSSPSANVVVRAQPPTPQIPVPGSITAPTCANPEGRVVLNGLPTQGTWTITSTPALINQTGSGSSASIRGLLPGTYTFTVTNSAGCVSDRTGNVVIPQVPNAPVLMITNPQPLCSPATVDLTTAAITAGSTPGLTYTYWTNSAATIAYNTPSTATSGTYYIKGTNTALCSDIEPVTVIIREASSADAGADQDLNYAFSTSLSANQPAAGETGLWSVFTGTGLFTDNTLPATTVTDLRIGENIFVWTLSNGACPPSSDTVRIFVRDIVIPTLITPNEDGVNDIFRLTGIEMMEGNQLFIFDRRGVVVYKNNDYMNDWNGVDYNNNPLPADTYFFILKTGNGRERSGYIVIRK